MSVREIIDAHPAAAMLDRDVLVRCVDQCLECSAACTGCADASLAEEDVAEMRRCIRLCLDCADVCAATARAVGRQTEADLGATRAIVEACATVCGVSGDECERHAAHHEHCRICAETCRRCEQICRDVGAALGQRER
jgi:Domain of Unknown Function (DUF326)